MQCKLCNLIFLPHLITKCLIGHQFYEVHTISDVGSANLIFSKRNDNLIKYYIAFCTHEIMIKRKKKASLKNPYVELGVEENKGNKIIES